jgi:DNA-binding NarL/FixJ family response regulator
VCWLLAEGKKSNEVASLLSLSTKTAETDRSNIVRKLEIYSVRDLVVYAVQVSSPATQPTAGSAA